MYPSSIWNNQDTLPKRPGISNRAILGIPELFLPNISQVNLEVPKPPNYEMAVKAAKTSIALKNSPYPGWKTLGIHPFCFCCGAEGSALSGLKIHPGRVNGSEMVAAPWVPASELGNESGFVRPEFIWKKIVCRNGPL